MSYRRIMVESSTKISKLSFVVVKAEVDSVVEWLDRGSRFGVSYEQETNVSPALVNFVCVGPSEVLEEIYKVMHESERVCDQKRIETNPWIN